MSKSQIDESIKAARVEVEKMEINEGDILVLTVPVPHIPADNEDLNALAWKVQDQGGFLVTIGEGMKFEKLSDEHLKYMGLRRIKNEPN